MSEAIQDATRLATTVFARQNLSEESTNSQIETGIGATLSWCLTGANISFDCCVLIELICRCRDRLVVPCRAQKPHVEHRQPLDIVRQRIARHGPGP